MRNDGDPPNILPVRLYFPACGNISSSIEKIFIVTFTPCVRKVNVPFPSHSPDIPSASLEIKIVRLSFQIFAFLLLKGER